MTTLVLIARGDDAVVSDARRERDAVRFVACSYDLDLSSEDVLFPSEYVTAADVDGVYERAFAMQRTLATARSSNGTTLDDFFPEPGVGFGWWVLSQCSPAIHVRVRFVETVARIVDAERPTEIVLIGATEWQAVVVRALSTGATVTERPASPSTDAQAAPPAAAREPAATSPREDKQRFLDEQARARETPAVGHLVLIMRGAGRAGGRRGERFLADEYSEGVADAVMERCRERGWRVTVIYEGKAPEREAERGGLLRRRTAPIVEVGTYDFRAGLRFPPGWQSVEAAAVETFLRDPEVARHLRHREVDLGPALAPVIASHVVRLADQAARSMGWRDVFAELQADVVIGGRLEANPFIVRAAGDSGAATSSVKLGLGNEMLPATFAYTSDGGFDAHNFPDALLVWGEESARLLRERVAGIGTDVVVSGRTRNDTFVRAGGSRKAAAGVRRELDVPKSAQLVVYGATSSTQYAREPGAARGACVMSPANYRRCLEVLAELADELPDVWVIVKPHPADREDAISAWTDGLGRARVRYLAARSEVHNVDLLASAALFVSSPSSMFGEAVLCDVPSIDIWTPDVAHFYEPRKRELFGRIAIDVDSPDALRAVATELLTSPQRRDAELARARANLEPIFGPLDGANAMRIVDAAMARARTSVS